MIIFLSIIIAILLIMLAGSRYRNKAILSEMEQFVGVREAALDIANRVVDTDNSTDLYQYILDTCLSLMPRAKFGSILMFNQEGLLAARASVGFNIEEITN